MTDKKLLSNEQILKKILNGDHWRLPVDDFLEFLDFAEESGEKITLEIRKLKYGIRFKLA